MIGGVALLCLSVVGIIGYLIFDSVFASNPVVLKVGDKEIRHDYFSARLEAFINQQGGALAQENLLPLGQVLLDDIAEEEVLLQSTDDLGISISDEDVQTEIETRIGATPETDFSAYRLGLEGELETSNLNEDQYRHIVEAELARTRVQEKFASEVGVTTLQARFHRLSVVTEEDAGAARQRLIDGEDFAEIALELDPTAVEPEDGPEFQTIDTQEIEIQDALRELEPDEVSEPIAIDDRFLVIQLLEREARLLDPGDAEVIATTRVTRYLEMRREEVGVEEDLSEEELIDAFEKAL